MMKKLTLLGVLALSSLTTNGFAASDTSNSPDVVPLSLQALVSELMQRNVNVYYANLENKIRQHKIAEAQGKYEPVFNASIRHDKTHVLNSAEEEISRFNQLEFTEDKVTTELSVNGVSEYGTEWEVGYRFARRESSVIDQFKNFDTEFSGNTNLTIRHPLLKGFGKEVNNLDIEIAKVNHLANQETYRETLLDLVSLGIKYYWELYSAQQLYNSWADSLDLAEKKLKRTRLDVAEGRLAKSELLHVKSAISDRKSELYEMQINISTVQNKLFSLLNLDRLQNQNIVFQAFPDAGFKKVTIPDVDMSLEQIKKNSPKFAMLQKRLEVEQLKLKKIKDETSAQLDVIANVNFSGLSEHSDTTLEDTLSGDYLSHYIGLEFSMPIDGNQAAKSQLAVTQLEIKKLKIEQVALFREVRNSVSEKIASLTYLQKQMKENTYRLGLEKELLRNVKKEYDYGRVSVEKIFERQEKMIARERELLNSLFRLQLTKSELNRTLGHLLNDYHVNIEFSEAAVGDMNQDLFNESGKPLSVDFLKHDVSS